jgi:hypothetical protein
MAANTMLPILLLTALKDQFLICPDVARCSTDKDKKNSSLSKLSDPSTHTHTKHKAAHSDANKDQCMY